MVETMQCLSVLALLCFLFGYSQGQCEVFDVEKKDVSNIHRCHQLYVLLEEALLKNDDNLYTLREVFFSSEHHSPSLLILNYQINDSSVPMFWSRSSLFKYVNLLLFLVCEPAVMAIAFQGVNAQLLPEDIYLSLSINESSVPNDTSAEEFVHSLSAMTAKVSITHINDLQCMIIAAKPVHSGW